MFARVKTSGQYQYPQIVQNRREGTKTIQRVVATIGRMDQIQDKGEIENLVRSLSRFSEKVLLVLSGKSDVQADAKKIGPALICERLWKELEIGKIIRRFLAERKFGFDVERAIFLTVLHRLFVSGSDRSCDRWHRDYVIDGIDALSLHHLYRAMAQDILFSASGGVGIFSGLSHLVILTGIQYSSSDQYLMALVPFDTSMGIRSFWQGFTPRRKYRLFCFQAASFIKTGGIG